MYLEGQDDLRDRLMRYLDSLFDFSEFPVGDYQHTRVNYKPIELKYLTVDKMNTPRGRNEKLTTIILGFIRYIWFYFYVLLIMNI